ncbi:dimethyladenosine transferase 2, mitochondrial [Phlebotomus argentipes]|uniref:dimethyladenosine transferase 2, mitochondrial n=1 Tax=Phlebotomus argentipes TaxID=94469 RepID=UPI002892FA06|nr:dimethyladenosine transferase 2, mitochondrial [Phlebotomus argentipes]
MIPISRGVATLFSMRFCRRTPLIQLCGAEKWDSPVVRLCTTVAAKGENPEEVPEKPKRKRKIRKPDNVTAQKEFHTFFQTDKQKSILNRFPEKYYQKKTVSPNHFYCVDESVAEVIAKRVSEASLSNCPIVEMNPGCGIVTKELLKLGNRKIHLFEADEAFKHYLQDIVEGNEEMTLKYYDLTRLDKLAFQDKLDNGNRVQTLLREKLPTKEWTEEPNVRIVGTIGGKTFFKGLVNSIIYQNGLLTYGRCEMFLVVPPPVYISLTCARDAGYLVYRYLTVLFQIFFEYEFIQKVPRKSFLPWQNDYNPAKYKKLLKVNSVDSDYLYLVRIVPRREAYELCPLEDMQALWFFVKQNMISRTNRIIPSMEKYVPYCGLRLISHMGGSMECREQEKPASAELPPLVQPCRHISRTDHHRDMNIFTQFGDLTPAEMLSLFYQFRNWPEYKQSPFLSLVENNLLKMFIAQDGNADEAETFEKSQAEDGGSDNASRL